MAVVAADVVVQVVVEVLFVVEEQVERVAAAGCESPDTQLKKNNHNSK